MRGQRLSRGYLTHGVSSPGIMKAFTILLLLCGTLHAADTTNPPPKDDGIALAQANGFGVQFFLVEGEKFFSDWEKPEPPHIAPIFIAKRGIPVCTAVIFAGAGLKPDGAADVTYDTVVRKPDGSVYAKDKNLVGAQEKTVEVVVRDKVKKVELHLVRKFTVEK